ncbi:MAG TPA: succinate dehydrogenase cytochrome b subunit [Gemmatimonadaceae bacterium]
MRRAGLNRFWDSSVGKKIVMGTTGLILVGFVVLHMAGNLQFFAGSERFDAYSNLLQVDLIELTWIMRVTLLAAVVLHIVAAYQLTMRSRAARPEDYARRDPQVSTYASRTMRWGGVYLLLFIPYHLLHFTTGTLHPAFIRGQAYGNVVVGFQTAWVSLFYLGAMAILSLHLYHGAWAAFRTLGFARPSNDPLHRRLAMAVAVIVPLGFSLLPLSVMLGFVR